MKKIILSAFMIASVILMYSCSQSSTPVDAASSGSNSMSVIASQVLPDNLLPSMVDPEIVDINSDGEVGFAPDLVDPGEMGEHGRMGDAHHGRREGLDTAGHMKDTTGHKPDTTGHRLDRGFKLRDIFWHLKLTDTQRPVIAQIMKDYANCVKTVMNANADQRKQDIAAANAQIRAIIDQVKAGTLDRVAAAAQIKAIKTDLKAKLDALIDKTALCNCWTTMVNAIKAALDTNQLALYEAWLAKLKHTPCDTGTTP